VAANPPAATAHGSDFGRGHGSMGRRDAGRRSNMGRRRKGFSRRRGSIRRRRRPSGFVVDNPAQDYLLARA
jgi:hypothetical protein